MEINKQNTEMQTKAKSQTITKDGNAAYERRTWSGQEWRAPDESWRAARSQWLQRELAGRQPWKQKWQLQESARIAQRWRTLQKSKRRAAAERAQKQRRKSATIKRVCNSKQGWLSHGWKTHYRIGCIHLDENIRPSVASTSMKKSDCPMDPRRWTLRSLDRPTDRRMCHLDGLLRNLWPVTYCTTWMNICIRMDGEDSSVGFQFLPWWVVCRLCFFFLLSLTRVPTLAALTLNYTIFRKSWNFPKTFFFKIKRKIKFWRNLQRFKRKEENSGFYFIFGMKSLK